MVKLLLTLVRRSVLTSLAAMVVAFLPVGLRAGTYSLDGIVLGSSLRDVIASAGHPDEKIGATYYWYGKDPYQWDASDLSILSLITDDRNRVAVLDLTARSYYVGNMTLSIGRSKQSLMFGMTTYKDFTPPKGAVRDGLCFTRGFKSPCKSFHWSDGTELVTVFGRDWTTEAWHFGKEHRDASQSFLSEVVLAGRDAFVPNRP
jgi:hypothetical protein